MKDMNYNPANETVLCNQLRKLYLEQQKRHEEEDEMPKDGVVSVVYDPFYEK